MPVKVKDNLPAKEILTSENIFVMGEDRALHQDIRELGIVILNLMPTKIVTETQFLRVLGNSPLQVDITLSHPLNHRSKNTPEEHLMEFYKTFDQIKDRRFDGMVITGAPLGHLSFEEVDYWQELEMIIDWANDHVFSTLYSCWGSEASLYHQYGVPKHPLPKKVFGVFPHHACRAHIRLLRGFDDVFYFPHSRHTEIRREDIEQVAELEILAESDEAGVAVVATRDRRQVFLMAHPEYEAYTLKYEYDRDLARGKEIELPKNYFPNDDPNQPPIVNWRAHGHLLYSNWLNYYVYQETPYDLEYMQQVMRAGSRMKLSSQK
jgi:homoserine O-succinyltransferase